MDMDHDEASRLLSRPTISIPEAGRLIGLGLNKSYQAARSGDLPTLNFAGKRVVPTGPLRQLLGMVA
jgi:hypothetical protein